MNAKSCFSPFIRQSCVASLLFVVLPALAFGTQLIQVSVSNQHGELGLLLIFIAVALYIYYLAAHFIPGVSALVDLMMKQFKTEKMVFISSYIAHQPFDITPKHSTEKNGQTGLTASVYMIAILANNHGRTAFKTTAFHLLEKGKSYTVTYGKRSKILISVLSESGEEMLLNDR